MKSWIVRARAVEGALELLKKPINSEIKEIYRTALLKLIEDPDEEVRGFTTEAFLLLFNQLQPQQYCEILNELLNNDTLGNSGKRHLVGWGIWKNPF